MAEKQDTRLLEVSNLRKYFPIKKGFFRKTVGNVKAVDDVSFYVNEGETLGLVGESGCGKTTTGRCVLRAIEPTEGDIRFRDQRDGWVNIRELDATELNRVRQQMQIIFQDPYSSLNPRMTLLELVGEPLVINQGMRGRALEERVAELLRSVGLRPEYLRRYPHAFSGGQRQRIGVARALALNPRFIVCDEPVSALDVSVQAEILNLLVDLRRAHGLTYIMVSHDLGVVGHLCERIGVMKEGRFEEVLSVEAMRRSEARSPYTRHLLESSINSIR